MTQLRVVKPISRSGGDLEFGGILVADGQPERAARFQDRDGLFDPLCAPIKIFSIFLAVVVLVVLVADVERGIGKDQIDRAGSDLLHQLDAVALMNLPWS